jgi:hypothetical protein
VQGFDLQAQRIHPASSRGSRHARGRIDSRDSYAAFHQMQSIITDAAAQI